MAALIPAHDYSVEQNDEGQVLARIAKEKFAEYEAASAAYHAYLDAHPPHIAAAMDPDIPRASKEESGPDKAWDPSRPLVQTDSAIRYQDYLHEWNSWKAEIDRRDDKIERLNGVIGHLLRNQARMANKRHRDDDDDDNDNNNDNEDDGAHRPKRARTQGGLSLSPISTPPFASTPSPARAPVSAPGPVSVAAPVPGASSGPGSSHPSAVSPAAIVATIASVPLFSPDRTLSPSPTPLHDFATPSTQFATPVPASAPALDPAPALALPQQFPLPAAEATVATVARSRSRSRSPPPSSTQVGKYRLRHRRHRS